ncbi:hypothetical protein [uncultured Paraglaciecola sp.]|uniref:hypothetical protein n=1 Tax=uncultured Paraglaciecola sp. TaxID=1765024 RepID=UPI00260D5279|nr:hypothetical protein [uncultured Paraglaciecola sp.]
MVDKFYCWQCNAQLEGVILPMSRREECTTCGKDIHVCKMCEFYDENKGCTEDRAEHQRELELANFCDYFKPSKHKFKAPNYSKSDLAKSKLAALFGDELPQQNLDTEPLSAAELAEKKLRDMLNNN